MQRDSLEQCGGDGDIRAGVRRVRLGDGEGVMNAYQRRVIEQGRAWVEGDARHNVVDDECCPDFSCCAPACFVTERGERLAMLNAQLRRYGERVQHDA